LAGGLMPVVPFSEFIPSHGGKYVTQMQGSVVEATAEQVRLVGQVCARYGAPEVMDMLGLAS
jgi:hypothetical protein